MRIGIIGMAASGKTTLFNALTGGAASTGGYGASRAHLGAAKVADARVDALSGVFRPRKTTHAAVNFVDAPGVGDSSARRADAIPQTLEGADALLVVVRAFADAGVPHPAGRVDPARDLANVRADLILRDLAVVERRLERVERLARVRKDPAEALESALLERMRAALEEGRPILSLEMAAEEALRARGFGFLSAKPLLVVANVGEEQLAGGAVIADLEAHPAPVALAARLEEELARLPCAERAAFLADYDLEASALDRVVRASFALLGLRCFFTVGEDEVRAWPVRAGSTALRAAGTIHSDLERGFIRAEVVSYADFMAAGSLARAREAGTLRLEGRDYVVCDGDILHVRFHV